MIKRGIIVIGILLIMILSMTTNAFGIDPSNYVIITTSAIQSASTQLQNFVDLKEEQGYMVAVITESTWGGGTGNTAADNIRTWLKANYLSLGIEYVLLIGNPTPSNGEVPMKICWPMGANEWGVPTDFYYGELSGNWDLDGDGYFGEYLGDYGTGGVDRYREVTVGRIPYYGSIPEVDSILTKTINYETSTDIEWRKNVLLPMKPLNSMEPSYPLGEAIKNEICAPAGYSSYRIYEENYGLNPPPEMTPCTISNVMSAWTSQPFGAVFWTAHGSYAHADSIIYNFNTPSLDNSHPVFTFQASCNNGDPDYPSNLTYALLKNGAIAVVSATKECWGSIMQTSFDGSPTASGMAYCYAKKLIQGMTGGDALRDIADNIDPYSTSQYNYWWMNYLDFNLFGDPTVGLYYLPKPCDYVIITTNAIKSASTQLQNFVKFKKLQGYKVGVVTENIWGGGTGNTAAENIRNWLKANYLSYNIKYVLLIGNPDPISGDVPMKKCYPEGYDGNNYVSTDFYYSELTGDWDLNEDGWYGDYWNDHGTGGFNNVGEVSVGRIPYYGTIADLDSILTKTINYEKKPLAEIGWRENVLLPMKSISYSWTNSYELGEKVKNDLLDPNNITSYRIYDDTYGLNPAPEATPCNIGNVKSAWTSQSFGAVCSWYAGGISLADVQELDNLHPAFTFQTDWNTANPEDSQNLAYSLLKNGAIVSVAPTKMSHYLLAYTPGDYHFNNDFVNTPSDVYWEYSYINWLYTAGYSSGDALRLIKASINPQGYNEYLWWDNYLSYNLYGDPSVGVYTHLEPYEIKDITMDALGYLPGSNVTITLKVKNNTDTILTNAQVYLYYYRPDNGAVSDKYLYGSNNIAVPNLAPGATATITTNFTVPATSNKDYAGYWRVDAYLKDNSDTTLASTLNRAAFFVHYTVNQSQYKDMATRCAAWMDTYYSGGYHTYPNYVNVGDGRTVSLAQMTDILSQALSYLNQNATLPQFVKLRWPCDGPEFSTAPDNWMWKNEGRSDDDKVSWYDISYLWDSGHYGAEYRHNVTHSYFLDACGRLAAYIDDNHKLPANISAYNEAYSPPRWDSIPTCQFLYMMARDIRYYINNNTWPNNVGLIHMTVPQTTEDWQQREDTCNDGVR